MDHKVNIRQLGHSIAKAHAELSALMAMLADQVSQVECRVAGCEQKLSWKVASPPETATMARCCGHEWYQGACIHCNITVDEWRARPPSQREPLGNGMRQEIDSLRARLGEAKGARVAPMHNASAKLEGGE